MLLKDCQSTIRLPKKGGVQGFCKWLSQELQLPRKAKGMRAGIQCTHHTWRLELTQTAQTNPTHLLVSITFPDLINHSCTHVSAQSEKQQQKERSLQGNSCPVPFSIYNCTCWTILLVTIPRMKIDLLLGVRKLPSSPTIYSLCLLLFSYGRRMV